MNIYDPQLRCLHLIENFSFGFHFSYFLIYTNLFFFFFLRSDVMKFFIFLWQISLWLWHHTHEYIFAPPFSSQTSFQSKAFSTFSLLKIDICRAFDIKINVMRYIGTSLRIYLDQTRLLTNHSWHAWRSIYNNQM